MFAEPGAGLRGGLRHGVEAADRVQLALAREQAVMDLDVGLGADTEGCLQEHVEGQANDPLSGVLDGDHAVVGPALLDLAEDIGQGQGRPEGGLWAELLPRRHVGVARRKVKKGASRACRLERGYYWQSGVAWS